MNGYADDLAAVIEALKSQRRDRGAALKDRGTLVLVPAN